MGFVDHGRGGTREPVAALLRHGNAGSNTAADQIEATQLALAQLPKKYRRGRQTLIRTDSVGGTHASLPAGRASPSRSNGSTLPGRISLAWNVLTPMGSGGGFAGQPTARKAQLPSGNGMIQEAKAGSRKAAGDWDWWPAPPLAVPHN